MGPVEFLGIYVTPKGVIPCKSNGSPEQTLGEVCTLFGWLVQFTTERGDWDLDGKSGPPPDFALRFFSHDGREELPPDTQLKDIPEVPVIVGVWPDAEATVPAKAKAVAAALVMRQNQGVQAFIETARERGRKTAHAAAQEKGFDVFVSHSGTDSMIVHEIVAFLEDRGYRCWEYERDAIAGVPHLEQTKSHVENCGVFIAVLSKEALASTWVTTEIHTAAGSQRPRLPILVAINYDTIPAQLQQAFGTAVGLRWEPGTDNSRVLEKLLRGVQCAVPR